MIAPIYRAKEMGKDNYIKGFLTNSLNKLNAIIKQTDGHTNKTINETTLSIHFPFMVDKNGKKIFASLNKETGVGGDKIYAQTYDSTGNMSNDVFRDTICVFKDTQVVFMDIIKGEKFYFDYNYFEKESLEVLGVKE